MSEQHRRAGRIGAHVSWARTEDRAVRTAPARRALRAKFEREVDPEGRLSEQELAIRTDHAMRAYFQRMALRREQARRDRRAS